MNVAERFGDKSEMISGFSPTALYLLASAPSEVVSQVEAKAAADKNVKFNKDSSICAQFSQNLPGFFLPALNIHNNTGSERAKGLASHD